MMKARQYDRRFFHRGIQPNVMAIEESNGLATWTETAGDSLAVGQLTFEDDFIRMVDDLIETFQDAKEYGSLLTVQPERYDALVDFIENAKQEAGNLLFRAWVDEVDQRILPLIRQATWLAAKYDIVVTTPPYMGSSNMSATLSAFVKKKYPDSKSDLFAAFIERCGDFARTDGYEALVTQHAWMFLSSYEKLRAKLLQKEIMSMAHLGARAFEEIGGEVVQTTAFVLANQHIDGYVGTYVRLVDANTQDAKEELYLSGTQRYTARQENFEKIPRSPIAYWVSEKFVNVFMNSQRLGDITNTKKGLATSDNARFLKYWYEPKIGEICFSAESNEQSVNTGKKWFPINKGGIFNRWFGNREYVINWQNDGYEIRNFKDAKGNLLSRPQNTQFNFRQALTWSKISSAIFSARFCEGGFLFDDSAAICNHEEVNVLKQILGFLNSKSCQMLLDSLNPTLNVQIGDIANLPILFVDHCAEIIALVETCIQISRADWDSYEISWDFARHPLLVRLAATLAAAYEQYKAETNARFDQLKGNEEELNRIFIDIYGLAEELTPEVEDRDVTVRRIFDTKEEIPASMKGSNYAITKSDVMKSLISYAVGCMFGRYSLDTPGLAYAGGAWDASKYKTFVPDEDGIIPISDNEYFDDDIVGRFVAFIAAAVGAETVGENLEFIADALGGRGSARAVIRGYFLTGFYADHVKTYQKRPIYWLFDSGKKNGFKCLIYMHRYRPDMLARIRTDYVHEQQSRYYTALEHLTDERDAAATAARNLLRATLGVEVFSHVVSIGRSNPYDGPEPTFDDLGAIDASPVRANTATPEGQAAEASMIAEIEAAKKAGDTLGGIVEVIVSGLPIGLGSHVSGDDRLDAQLAAALMSIQAIKGVEIGDGFAEARRRGSEAHDEIIRSGHTLTRTTNRAGGLEGGMTNGETLRVRAAMKPISTVPRALKSVDMATGKPATGIHQRSDVCAVPAAGVVAEAMVALVVARAVLQKFGGDSLGETKRNIAAYQEHVARRVQFPDDVN